MIAIPRPWMLLALILGLGSLLTGCGSEAATPTLTGGSTRVEPVGTVVVTDLGQYTNITPATLYTMMERKDFFLVDVHVPHEGQMPALDARIPYDQIADQRDQLPPDKGAKIVLVCRSGYMSSVASRTLADLGYTRIYNMVGGFDSWRAAGYPFTPEAPATP